jgi:hypothetical protein
MDMGEHVSPLAGDRRVPDRHLAKGNNTAWQIRRRSARAATKHVSPETACCADQMFLDSGDGVVFKGNIGPRYAPKTGEFHLSATAARTLLEQALESYRLRC